MDQWQIIVAWGGLFIPLMLIVYRLDRIIKLSEDRLDLLRKMDARDEQASLDRAG